MLAFCQSVIHSEFCDLAAYKVCDLWCWLNAWTYAIALQYVAGNFRRITIDIDMLIDIHFFFPSFIIIFCSIILQSISIKLVQLWAQNATTMKTQKVWIHMHLYHKMRIVINDTATKNRFKFIGVWNLS